MRFPMAVASLLTLVSGVGCARAEDFRVNGVPLSLERRVVWGDATQIASTIAQDWRRHDPSAHVTVKRGSSFVILGRQSGAIHQTLRLRPLGADGTVEVLASSVDLRVAPSPIPSGPFSFPSGTWIESVVEPSGAATGVTYVGGWPGAHTQLLALVRTMAGAAGWRARAVTGSAAAADSNTLQWWTRGNELVAVRAWSVDTGSRFVVVHEPATASRQVADP